MIYPVVLLLVAVLIISGLMVYIVPDMVNVIVDTGQELPWFTVALIVVTSLMASWWLQCCWPRLFAGSLVTREARSATTLGSPEV